MTNPLAIARRLLPAVLAAAVACTGASVPDVPDTPAMPVAWKVVFDETFTEAGIKPVSQRLGGEVSALRNTRYDVGGKEVQLNMTVAATAKDADRIMETLRKMKPEEFFLRRGLIIYEFVGKNAAIPEMREGMALLAKE